MPLSAFSIPPFPLEPPMKVQTEWLSAQEAGRIIADRRRELGLTQDQVVDNTTIRDKSHLSKFERGALHIGRSPVHFGSVARYLRLTRDQMRAINPGAIVPEEEADPRPQEKLLRMGAEVYDGFVNVPIYGSVAAGTGAALAADEPEEWMTFDMRELPRGVDAAKLFILVVNGDSMTDEGLLRSIPYGSRILVEAGAPPADAKVVVAWIPALETGVVKQYFSQGAEVLLRSYNPGGPTFWSSDYPDMTIVGVVRRVIWEP